MERGRVQSTSRSSSKAGGVGHVLSDFMLPTSCGWVFDLSRAHDHQFGSRTQSRLRALLQFPDINQENPAATL